MRHVTLIALVVIFGISFSMARPFKSPVIDGVITGDGTDWDYGDLGVDDPLGDSPWGPNDIDDLWATYDSLNLYIGVRYQVDNNAMLVMVDAGTGSGTADLNGLDWYPRNFVFPDSLRCEFLIAGWNGGALGVRRIINDTYTDDITSLCETADLPAGGSFHEAEIRIPWGAIYESGPGAVAPGARIRLVALIAGGDSWNGPDSAPDNPGMDGMGGPTTISTMYILPVDRDADGLPDPFRGSIAGTVDLDDPEDISTVVDLSLFIEGSGKLVDMTETDPGGGDYIFSRLGDASYRVAVSAPGYAGLDLTGLAISGQNALAGVDMTLTAGGSITGQVAFADGPGNDATVAAYDSVTGLIAGGGAVDIPPAGGSFELQVPDGTYHVIACSPGYVPDTITALVAGGGSVDVGTISLSAVRATGMVLIDDDGDEIPGIAATVSFPDSGIYFYARARIEARDDAGRRDLFDPAGILDQIIVRPTQPDGYSPPLGAVTFYGSDTLPLPDSTTSLTGGRCEFLITDDAIETLHIYAESSGDSSVWGRFDCDVAAAEPEFISLTALADTILADGTDEATVQGRLLDIGGGPADITGVEVHLSFAPSSTAPGSFTTPTVVTTIEGEFSATLIATGLGELHVTAAAVYGDRDLVVIGDDDRDYVGIAAVAGDPTAIILSSESEKIGLGQSMGINAQLVDGSGNPVDDDGYSLSFSSYPAEAGTVAPTVVDLGGDGSAAVTFTADTLRSAVNISAEATPPIDVEGVSFLIEKLLLVTDPSAPEPDPDHNSISEMDLTVVTVSNTPEAIHIEADFSTVFDEAHMILLLETGYGGPTYGGTSDPFGFPVTYQHTNRPDFALTYKYSAGNYADLRFWDGQWVWWDDAGRQYRTDWVPGIDIHSGWITRNEESVEFDIPLYVFDSLQVPDSIRVEVYVTQGEDPKRSAFDSAPHDSTLDIDFDPADPETDWSITETPVSLHHYSEPYGLDLVFPAPPILSNPAADPAIVAAGDSVTFTVDVAGAGGGIGDVLIDLSPLGGSRFQRMADDGTGGDAAAGDSTFSYRHAVNPQMPGGEYTLGVSAKDASNISRADTTISFNIEAIVTIVRAFADSTGDDHGPDMPGMSGLYYVYPTNGVFVPGAFDIVQCRIFEITKIVAGEFVPSLAFEVTAGDVPDPADPGTADWNPLFADINIHKVDIYIDAFPGGATEGLPNRQNDFAAWDAWDYAIVMEGWYKAVLTSNGQNTPAEWAETIKKTDRDIILVSDFESNTITGVVSKAALGYPSVEDIQTWDIMVVMTSHDGLSNDINFGDTRWVNAGVSQWQFGGGHDTDRDANIIDLLGSPGVGKAAGRGQSELLDYTSPEAVARAANGQTAVVLEITAADTTAALLRSFACSSTEDGIEISWTLSEAGESMEFMVRRERDGTGGFLPIDAAVERTGIVSYRAVDRTCAAGSSYRYRVDVTDEAGARTLFTTYVIAAGTPKLALGQNYPNPFNPSTTLSYSIPERSRVTLDIFDVSGRRIVRLVDAVRDAGRYEAKWMGRAENGAAVSSGVYFYKLTAGKKSITRKLVLIR